MDFDLLIPLAILAYLALITYNSHAALTDLLGAVGDFT